MLFNNLPLYQATIDNSEDTGMFVVSLVEFPAIEKSFMAFSEQKELKLSVVDEEKQMVFGPVAIADMPIYRRDADGYEYYIMYTKETIAKMVEKYFEHGFQNNVDVEHNFELQPGVILTQAFIKDTEKGIAPTEYPDVSDGSLFFQFHITDNELWEKVKAGEVTGFSLAGTFGVEPVRENNKKENYMKMKLNKIKTALQKALMAFANLATDKGLISYASDGELPEIGEEISIVDEEGNETPAEDGEYTLEDKTVIVVVEGKVSEIREPEKPEETPVEAEDEEPAEETPAEETPAEPASEPSVSADEVEALKERIKNLEEEVARLEKENGELKERIAELESEPAAEPAQEEFEKVVTVEKTGNKKLDRLNAILNAK